MTKLENKISEMIEDYISESMLHDVIISKIALLIKREINQALNDGFVAGKSKIAFKDFRQDYYKKRLE